MTTPTRPPEPFTWPTQLYELAADPTSGRFGEMLQLCTAHRGLHVRHGSERTGFWCQSLPPHRRGARISRLRRRTAPEPPPVVVELDPALLARTVADAVADALARRPGRRQSAPSAEPKPAEPIALRTVRVWEPTDDDES
jgi:hypothetical protein